MRSLRSIIDSHCEWCQASVASTSSLVLPVARAGVVRRVDRDAVHSPLVAVLQDLQRVVVLAVLHQRARQDSNLRPLAPEMRFPATRMRRTARKGAVKTRKVARTDSPGLVRITGYLGTRIRLVPNWERARAPWRGSGSERSRWKSEGRRRRPSSRPVATPRPRRAGWRAPDKVVRRARERPARAVRAREDSNVHGITTHKALTLRSACPMRPRAASRAVLCPAVSDPDASDGMDVLKLALTALPGRDRPVSDALFPRATWAEELERRSVCAQADDGSPSRRS